MGRKHKGGGEGKQEGDKGKGKGRGDGRTGEWKGRGGEPGRGEAVGYCWSKRKNVMSKKKHKGRARAMRSGKKAGGGGKEVVGGGGDGQWG